MTRKHLCKRHQGSTRQTESVNHRAGRNIKSFFPYKDRLARSLISKVIYKTVAGIVVKFTSVKHSVGYIACVVSVSNRVIARKLERSLIFFAFVSAL